MEHPAPAREKDSNFLVCIFGFSVRVYMFCGSSYTFLGYPTVFSFFGRSMERPRAYEVGQGRVEEGLGREVIKGASIQKVI